MHYLLRYMYSPTESKEGSLPLIIGEAVATQHRPLILEMELEKPKRIKKRSREKTIKWWNLTNGEFELKFITQVGETVENN